MAKSGKYIKNTDSKSGYPGGVFTRISVKVRNIGSRPVMVGSSFHFFEVTRFLEFDREKTFGFHLDIPAATAIRFNPGEVTEVELVNSPVRRGMLGVDDLGAGYPDLEMFPACHPGNAGMFRRIGNYASFMGDDSYIYPRMVGC